MTESVIVQIETEGVSEATAKIKGLGNTTENSMGQAERNIIKGERALSRLRAAAEGLGGAYIRVQDDIAATNRLIKSQTISASEGADMLRKFEAQARRLEKSSTRGLGGIRNLGTAVQQAGYQVGDFAVQVASGQSAVTAFVQQGAQLVSMFGPAGAVAGAVLGIGGAMYYAFGQGEDAAEGLDAKLLELQETIDQTSDGTDKLREAQERLNGTWVDARVAAYNDQITTLQEKLDEIYQRSAQFVSRSRAGDYEMFSPVILAEAAGVEDQIRKVREELELYLKTLEETDKAVVQRNINDLYEELAIQQELSDEYMNGAISLREMNDELRIRKQALSFEGTPEQLEEYTNALREQAQMVREVAEEEKRRSENAKRQQKEEQERIKAQQKLWRNYMKSRERASKEFWNKYDDFAKEFADAQKDYLEEEERAYKEHYDRIKGYVDTVFDGMTNSLADFVTTGKLNFKDLANSIINDMIRMVIQQSITAPLAAAVTGAIAGPNPTATTGATAGVPLATGGYVSGPGTGTSDSIPAWLSNGEYVINAKQTKAFRPLLEAINSGNVKQTQKFNMGGYVGSSSASVANNNTVVNVYDQRGGNSEPVQASESRGPNGERQIDLLIRNTTRRQIEQGEHDGAMGRRYGSKPNMIRRGG